MTETSCQEIAASFSDRFVTRQELEAAEETIDYCEDTDALETMRRRLVDLEKSPDDYGYEPGAWEYFQSDLQKAHPLASRLQHKIDQLWEMAHPVHSGFRLFVGGGLSRASAPNEAPEMPTDGWLQGGGLYAIGNERFRVRLGLVANWSGNEEVGGIGLGFFIGDEFRIPSLDLMTHVDTLYEVVLHPKVSGIDFSPVPLQLGVVWGLMYEGFHPVHFGASVGFLMQENERIDRDMAWVGANFAYAM